MIGEDLIISKGNLITAVASPMIPTNRIVAQLYVNDIINVFIDFVI